MRANIAKFIVFLCYEEDACGWNNAAMSASCWWVDMLDINWSSPIMFRDELSYRIFSSRSEATTGRSGMYIIGTHVEYSASPLKYGNIFSSFMVM